MRDNDMQQAVSHIHIHVRDACTVLSDGAHCIVCDMQCDADMCFATYACMCVCMYHMYVSLHACVVCVCVSVLLCVAAVGTMHFLASIGDMY